MTAAQETEFIIPPGTVVLEKYRVEAMLGVGGMGLVVQATHATLGTPVAIKFLLPQYAASTEAARRFLREAQAASTIKSEHTVRVYDTGSQQPYGPYIVMEFLHGHDLSRHLRQTGVFSIEAAVDFAVQASRALAEAHAHNIVHRDIKPANLFLIEQPDGAPLIKVLDFGISKVLEQKSLEVTKTTAILGSGLYMSPEQMKSSKTVDHRTDVYALGVTIFELLTRTQPFTADSFAELAIKVNMELPSDIRQFRPDVPEGLAHALARAYAKKADDRYQSVGEFALALAPWAAERTKPAIEALARTETRRGRAPSMAPPAPSGSPSASGLGKTSGSNPSYPHIFESQLRLPPPPSLPTPSSVGMDTFGLSKARPASGRQSRSEDSLHQTNAEQSFALQGKRTRPGAGLLGIGVVVGVVFALGMAALLYYRSQSKNAAREGASSSAPAARVGSSATASADVPGSVTPSQVDVAPSSSQSVVASTPSVKSTLPSSRTASARPSTSAPASASATAPSSASAAPTASATASTPSTTAPQWPDPAAPCKMRNVEGQLIDCP